MFLLWSKDGDKFNTILPPQSEETELASQLDSDTGRMLEFSDKAFKTTIIKMLTVLVDKVESGQEPMSNVSREMKS